MTLRLRGNAWYLKKTVQVNGKSVRREFPLKVFGGETARKQAEAAAKKLEKDIDRANATAGVMAEFGIKQQTDDTADVPTLREWWAKVKALYSSRDDNNRVETWLALPFAGTSTWGATALDQIKKSDCLAGLAARRKQHRRTRGGKVTAVLVSEATVQRERGLMQAVLQRAVDDEIIERNPWIGIDKPSGNVGRRNEDGSLRLLEPADEKKLMKELTPRQQRWVRFVLLTGMRMEGALELRAEHVIERDGHTFAHISEKSRAHNVACPVCGRKNKKCREVPLVAEAQKIVKDQIEADGQLWHGMTGIISIQSQLAHATIRAGIHRVSPHDLRFTFGHRYLVAGGILDDLSRILGHSDSRITLKHYAYLKPSDLADKMTAVMEPGKPQTPKGRVLQLVATSR
jgi:integrase